MIVMSWQSVCRHIHEEIDPKARDRKGRPKGWIQYECESDNVAALNKPQGPLKAYKSQMEFMMYHLDALEGSMTALGLMADIADRAIQDLDTLTFRIVLLLVNIFIWGQGMYEKYFQNDAEEPNSIYNAINSTV